MQHKSLIKTLEDKYALGFPRNMPNSLSVASAIVSLEDDTFINKSREYNNVRKQDFYSSPEALKLKYIKSSANIVYFNVEKSKTYKHFIWENKILLAGEWPSKPEWARVTMGFEKDMDFLMEKMQGKK